jgi:hypothetical protein
MKEARAAVIRFRRFDLIVNGFIPIYTENMKAKTNKKRGKH